MNTFSTVNQRFTLIINDYLKLNDNDAARLLNVSRQTITNIANSRSKPSYDVLNALILSTPNLNTRWLMTGDGEMLLSEHAQPQSTTPKEKAISNDPEIAALRAIIQNYEVHIAALQATISDKNKIIALLEGSGARQSK
jgi:transcriptional regulator with XRE-family HTH domain